MLKILTSFFLSLSFLLSASLYADCKKIRDYIFENLPEYGTLVQDDRGFVYVDLPNDYIYKLNPLIAEKGFELPPYFGPGLHGAHISVIYAGEATENNIKIKEAGQTIYFSPKDCKVVKPGNWQDVDAVYIIQVDAPALDKLRKRYGLSKAAYPFHITIGIKYGEEQEKEVESDAEAA